jgi:prepilin-type N-terminal cleavage/methylation domain-containing protein
MKRSGYSLVEVVLAAAILAVGLSAAAALVNTLVIQQERNTSAVRAANLQEQSVMLYRLGVTNPAMLYALLPEPTGSSPTPPAGTFSMIFGSPTGSTASVSSAGGATSVAYEVTSCTVTYGSAGGEGGVVTYLNNTVNIVRPVIRVGP